MQLGTWADWVAAIGTTGAFFTGFWIAWRAHKDGNESRLQARRAQASRIFATAVRAGASGGDIGGVPVMTVYQKARVVNASENPVIDVVVRVGIEPPSVIHGGGAAEVRIPHDVMLPGETTHDVSFLMDHQPGFGAPAHEVHVSLDFTDSAGVRWHRDHRQVLSEIPAGRPA